MRAPLTLRALLPFQAVGLLLLTALIVLGDQLDRPIWELAEAIDDGTGLDAP